MGNHTPGPWVVKPRKTIDVVRFAVEAPNGPHNENFPTGTWPNWIVAENIGAEANARLIAAAPEMLEALEGIANATASSDGFDPFKAAERFQAIARAALAKANGE